MNKLTKICIGLIVLAYGLTIFSLTDQSIRLDESQSIWTTTKDLPAVFYSVVQDVHVPLYFVLLHFWLQLFGIDITVIRILSLFFSILTLPILYRLAKESGSDQIAILTITLFALSPFIMWYSNEARMYTLLTFVTSLNSLYFLRVWHSQGKSNKLGYFLSLVFGFYTHYFFIFLVIAQGIFLLLYPKSKKLFFTFVAIIVSAGSFLLPWIYYFLKFGGGVNTQPLIPPPTSFNLIQAFINFLFGFQPQGIQAVLISLWPLLIIILFFVFTQRQHLPLKNIRYFILATFTPVILIFLISYFKPIFLVRYLIFVTPTLFVLTAWLLVNLPKRIAPYLTSFILIVMLGLLAFQNVSAQTPIKEDYRGVTDYLNQHVMPQDIVEISSPFTIYPIEYSYHGPARLSTIPEWDRYKVGPVPPFNQNDFVNQIQIDQKQYNRLFLVVSYDQGYQNQILNYLDHHLQMQSKIDFSPGLELRTYQLRYDSLTQS